MPQLARYQATFSQFPFMQTAVGTVYEDIMMFHLEAVKLFKQKCIQPPVLLNVVEFY